MLNIFKDKYNSYKKLNSKIIINPIKISVVLVLAILFVYVNLLQNKKQELEIKQSASVDTSILNASAGNDKFITLAEAKKLINSENLSTNQSLAIFPIGSIYMTTTSTNPGNFIGGNWIQWGNGQVPIGVDLSDPNYNSAEMTGGSATSTLTLDQIPNHNHTFTGAASTTSSNSTNPTAKFNGIAVNSANNNTVATATFTGSSTGVSISDSHTHDFSGTTSADGGHTHDLYMYNTDREFESPDYGASISGGFGGRVMVWGPGYIVNGVYINSNGNHTHTASGNTGTINTDHTHSVTAAGNVILSNTSHSHTASTKGTVNLSNTKHSHSVSINGVNSNAGSSTAHNNLQPYIVYYMWKRVG